jgi:hypothetical protein
VLARQAPRYDLLRVSARSFNARSAGRGEPEWPSRTHPFGEPRGGPDRDAALSERAWHSREIWKKRVERWADSGLSAREFAAEIGVNVHTLTHWKWQLGLEARRQGSAPAPSAPSTFVEVVAPLVAEPSNPTVPAAFELEFARGTRLRVPANFDAALLRRLVEVLEGR